MFLFNFENQFLKNKWNFMLLALAIGITLSATCSNLHHFFFYARQYDFHRSYVAARALIFGNNLYESDVGGYIYPPFYAFMLTPLAHYSEAFAHLTWLSINLLLIVTIPILGFHILASGLQLTYTRWQAAGACALAVILSHDQIYQELIQNQNDLLLLGGFALALLWLDTKPFLAGTVLGLITMIKYQGIFFLPYLLFRARWRAAIGLIVGVAIGAFLPALMIGWSRNLEYLKVAYRGMASMASTSSLSVDYAARVPKITWLGNISISSGLLRIFQNHGWPPEGVLFIVLLIALFIFFFLKWVLQKESIPFLWRTPRTLGNVNKEKTIVNLEWCVMLIVMLILSPQCNRRHLLLLMNVNLLVAVMLLFPRHLVKRWPLLLGTLIMQLGLMTFKMQHTTFSFLDYAGFPCWGYLIFLPIFISSVLSYFQDIYHPVKPPLQTAPQPQMVELNFTPP